jgi:peptidyl-tRNA hydrolase, PTH2 family
MAKKENPQVVEVDYPFKQVIIIRTDIEMGVGKKVAQGCHAAVIAVEEARKMSPDLYRTWFTEGQKKIALKVQSENELKDLYLAARHMHLPCSIVEDAGLTQLTPGTITAAAIGPAKSIEIDKITGKLKLL